MTEETAPKNNIVQGFGIASLVIGVLALPLSFVPCCGTMAIIPAIIGVLLGGVGLIVAKYKNCSGGISTAALVVSGIAFAVALFQIIYVSDAAGSAAAKVKARAEGQQSTGRK
jgi:uncharacterized membrane protein